MGSAHDLTALPAPGPRDRNAATEMMVGGILVALVAVGGLYFALRPSPVVMDGWFSFLVSSAKGTWFTSVTVLRYPVVIVAGAILAAAVSYRRDPPRAWACLIGPILALATCELVVKPLVGPTRRGVLLPVGIHHRGRGVGRRRRTGRRPPDGVWSPRWWRRSMRYGWPSPSSRSSGTFPPRRLRPRLRRGRRIGRRRIGVEGGGPPASPVQPASTSRANPSGRR